MPNCVVPHCKNRSNCNKKSEGVTYHKLPRDPVRREKWIDALIKLGRDDNWFPSNSSVVCSDHFHNDQFTTSTYGKRIILKVDALPLYKVPNKITVHSKKYTYYENNSLDDTLNSEENVGTNPGRKRLRINTEYEGDTTKKLRQDFDDIVIDYDNIDKFGEQIAFLLKRIPRQLCKELQGSIVSLVKNATRKYESETNRDAIPSTSSSPKVIDVLSQIVLTPTLVTKPNINKDIIIKEETADTSDEVNTSEDEITQATQYLERQLATQSDQRFTSKVKVFPKPMTLPIELIGSMDCVKKEVLDPGESSNTEQYQCIEDTTTELTLADPLETDIKVEVDEMDLVQQPYRRASF